MRVVMHIGIDRHGSNIAARAGDATEMQGGDAIPIWRQKAVGATAILAAVL